MLSLVWPETLKDEVIQAQKPVLFALLNKDESYQDQIKALEKVIHLFNKHIKVCLGIEEFLESFFEHFGINGAPLYFLFYDGKEVQRFFGHAKTKDLIGIAEVGVRLSKNKKTQL